MDLDDVTAVLRQTGADLWGLIDAAISLAARDHGRELRARRDGIVERLYLATVAAAPRQEEGGRSGVGEREGVRANGRVVPEEKESGGGGSREWKGRASPSSPQSLQGEEDDEEEEREYEREHEHEHEDLEVDEDDEKTKILAIKEHIEDPDQDEDTLITLLQNLLDMDITYKSLRETDIGRHVNNLRKHVSFEVRRLVKLLVRKWKDLVADWVKLNANETGSSAIAAAIITDGDSPQQMPSKNNPNGYHGSDYGYSPNPHHAYTSSEKNSRELEPSKQKAPSVQRRESPAPVRPAIPTSYQPQSVQSSKCKEQLQQKDGLMDPERLASARRRLHENYQEIQNAKKQRTIQVMDIHEIPKKKNTFIPKNKQGMKHW